MRGEFHPPRNRELERLVIDVLRATPADAPDHHAAWQVYADWLLESGEPVGEWLAASLRADDGGEAAAPVRAKLGEIERACRFRLFDNDLADLSEVPELARIADFTWERGFVTRASVRCRMFRAWDSELLGHTPDRLIDVVLRSPSACMLHELELDAYAFSAVGSRHRDLGRLLEALPEPLPLRALTVSDTAHAIRIDGSVLARMPELAALELRAGQLDLGEAELHLAQLERLCVRVSVPRSGRRDVLAPVWRPDALPNLRRLELSVVGAGDHVAALASRSPLLDGLTHLSLGPVGDVGVGSICAVLDRYTHLEQFELLVSSAPPHLLEALGRAGCRVSRPGRAGA